MEIPKKLRHRPIYAGYVVPYVQYMRDGVPDFRVIDEVKKLHCLKHRLCALCGIRLDRTFALIGGEQSARTHLFTDPPDHSECARYAAVTCPFLRGDIGYSDRPFVRSPEEQLAVSNLVDTRRPDRMAIFYTRSFELVRFPPDPMTYIRAGEFTSVDWSAIPRSSSSRAPEPSESSTG